MGCSVRSSMGPSSVLDLWLANVTLCLLARTRNSGEPGRTMPARGLHLGGCLRGAARSSVALGGLLVMLYKGCITCLTITASQENL